nr:LysR family transcriptional regulator [uncultured Holophaga sp.]
MEWLNYHHLFYFWTIAREGSVTGAARLLRLSQSALSTQIRQLEENLGEKLFERRGRGLVLTEAGRVALRYAEDIFKLGQEFQNELKGRPSGRPLQLRVGISDVLPKLMVHQLLRPVLEGAEPIRLLCRESGMPTLFKALFEHEVDLVLSDSPYVPLGGPRAFNRLLTECGLALFAAPALMERHPGPFPRCLDGAPVLLQAEGTALRTGLDRWFQEQGLVPVLAGEFEDSALLKAFGAAGEGFFAVPEAISDAVVRRYQVERVGQVEAVRFQVHGITAERRVSHPGLAAILGL